MKPTTDSAGHSGDTVRSCRAEATPSTFERVPVSTVIGSSADVRFVPVADRAAPGSSGDEGLTLRRAYAR